MKEKDDAFARLRWAVRGSSMAHPQLLDDAATGEPIWPILQEEARRRPDPAKQQPPSLCIVHEKAPEPRRTTATWALPEAQIKLQ